nr:unnamed protein product [Digitaria exilis]
MGGIGASPCDLDREFAPQIAQLLATPTLQSAQEYYDELIRSKKHDGVRLSYSGKHGKGVCANRDFAEENLILKDQMLVGAQHSLNKSIGASMGSTSERHCHGSDVGSSTGTNDIFLVAAKAITFTLLRFKKLKRQPASHESNFSLLMEAWKPLGMGFKKSDLVVASPIEDYFIHIDDLPESEKITISYIDEDLSYEERQAQLADYGFTCECSKCQEERPV